MEETEEEIFKEEADYDEDEICDLIMLPVYLRF